MPTVRKTGCRYIICPDLECPGWMMDHLQCENSRTTQELFPDGGYELCPHLDRAKKVVFCHYGHPIEERVNSSNWTHSLCPECHSMSFDKMSTMTYRIPLEKYEEFLKLPFNNDGHKQRT